MTNETKTVPPASELRCVTEIPRSTIQNLRDLNYFGSDSPTGWKSGYKKDYRFYQQNELVVPDQLGLRQKGEVVLKEETTPVPLTESQVKYKLFPPGSLHDPSESTVHYSKASCSYPAVFAGDSRLTSFETTSHRDLVPLDVKPRDEVDKAARQAQSKSFSLADRPVTKDLLQPKNIIEFPKYEGVDRPKPRFFTGWPCQIGAVLKEQPKIPFDARTTTSDAFPAHGVVEQQHALVRNDAPRAALLHVTNEIPGNSESRTRYVRHSDAEAREARSEAAPFHENHKDEYIFHKDPRIGCTTTTTHDAHSATSLEPRSDRSVDHNGKLKYDYIFDDILSKDLKMEQQYIPRHIHQQSLTSDNFRSWHKDVYKRPTRNFSSFKSTLPMGFEDSSWPVNTTTHKDSFVSNPIVKPDAVRQREGSIHLSLPFGAPIEVKESECQGHYKKWDVDLPDSKSFCKLMQKSSIFIEDKDKVDYTTTSQRSFPHVPMVETIPAVPQKDRNPILNDAQSCNHDSPFCRLDATRSSADTIGQS